MAAGLSVVDTYRQIADWYHNHGQPQHRDRFLVLAMDRAFSDGQGSEAESLRQKLLRHNPHHLFKPFANYPQALKSPDVQSYLGELRRSYPPQAATSILASLGSIPQRGVLRSTTVLPPTQPVIDFSQVSDDVDAGNSETLQIYSIKKEFEELRSPDRPKGRGPSQVVVREDKTHLPSPYSVRPPEPIPIARSLPRAATPESVSPWRKNVDHSEIEKESAINAGLCLALTAAMAVVCLGVAVMALARPLVSP